MLKQNRGRHLKKRENEAFTLIELLVVISIIGLLASVVLVALNGARQKARDSKRVQDMTQIAKALELYYNERSAYPTSTVSLSLAGGLLNASTTPNLIPRYLRSLPSAPSPADNPSGSTVCNTSGRGGNNYWYETSSNGAVYTLTFCLGNTTGTLTGGTRYMTPGGFR